MLKFSQHKKLFFFILKLLVFGVTLFYLVRIFRLKEQKIDFHAAFSVFNHKSYLLLLLVFLLMFINWWLESVKWSFLINKIEQSSGRRSLKAVLSGLALNNWIPYGLADYGGRVAWVTPANRKKALYAVFLGNWGKFIASFGLGIFGLLLYYNPEKLFFIYNFLAVFSVLFLIYLYFNMDTFYSRFRHWGLVQKAEKVDRRYRPPDLRKNLLLSFLRYLVYIIQYSLILKIFHFPLEMYHTILGVVSIFFIQSFLPSFAITELGIRGAVIIFIFGSYYQDYNILLFASFSLWFINVLLPSLAGLFFLVSYKKTEKT